MLYLSNAPLNLEFPAEKLEPVFYKNFVDFSPFWGIFVQFFTHF